MSHPLTKGEIIEVLEKNLGIRIDPAMPQITFDELRVALDGAHPQDHFIGFAYPALGAEANTMGIPLPMTLQGWEAFREVWSATFANARLTL